MQLTVAQAETDLIKLEADKQIAERELSAAKANMKTLNVQMVIAGIGFFLVLPILWLIFLIAVKLPQRSKAVKEAEAKLRNVEDAIMAKRIEIAELRARSASA